MNNALYSLFNCKFTHRLLMQLFVYLRIEVVFIPVHNTFTKLINLTNKIIN